MGLNDGSKASNGELQMLFRAYQSSMMPALAQSCHHVGLCAILCAPLGQNVAASSLDRLLAERELRRHLLVGVAGSDQTQDADLAISPGVSASSVACSASWNETSAEIDFSRHARHEWS